MEGEAWSAGRCRAGRTAPWVQPGSFRNPRTEPPLGFGDGPEPGEPVQSDDGPVCSSLRCHHTPAYMFLIYLSRVFLKLLVGKKKQFIPVKYMTLGVLEKHYF